MKKRYKLLRVIFLVLFISIVVLWIVDVFTKFLSNVSFMSTELIKELMGIFETLIIMLFINNELRNKEAITKKSLDLETQGITKINRNGAMDYKELKDFFLNSKEIKIGVAVGLTFFKKNEELFIKALDNGTKIKMIMVDPYSDFLKEITEHLDAIGSKEKNKENNQQKEIFELITRINDINNNRDNKIEISFFNTEYRVPFYLAYQQAKDGVIIKGWYNSIIPVRSPRQMLMFSGEIEEDKREEYVDFSYKDGKDVMSLKENKRNFIFDLECHFDYVWNKHLGIVSDRVERISKEKY